jgi:hypothetical protein
VAVIYHPVRCCPGETESTEGAKFRYAGSIPVGWAGPGRFHGAHAAALDAATAYGSGAIILLTAIPMLIIASAYRRLNLGNANCRASFEWVGRAING